MADHSTDMTTKTHQCCTIVTHPSQYNHQHSNDDNGVSFNDVIIIVIGEETHKSTNNNHNTSHLIPRWHPMHFKYYSNNAAQ